MPRATPSLPGLVWCGGTLLLTALLPVFPAQPVRAQEAVTPPPSVSPSGTGAIVQLDTPRLMVSLDAASQTVVALESKDSKGFDFAPSDRRSKRIGNGYYALGDLTLRTHPVGSSAGYQSFSTATERQPVRVLPTPTGALAAADLTPTLPADCPLQITRTWVVADGNLTLRFAVTNRTAAPVEVGALGIPMVFNNIISDRSLEQAHAVCSFSDPYIGQDAGYLQVTRLSGKGPALVVVPDGKTPFEAYHPLREPTRPNQTFEGMFEWMAHSRAYAENEWRQATPWNPPTTAVLAPGETRTYGVRFLVADEIRNIEITLAANRRPVAVGIPGYILPADQQGRLFLNYPGSVRAVTVEPKDALTVRADKPTPGGWKAYTLEVKGWGRARVTVNYDDGTQQAIHYYLTKPATQTVADLGNFLTTKQWFVDPTDPFHRSPSVLSYDREANQQVTQDSRVWIAGLGDEGGSGSWLAAAMKEFGQPNREELAKYQQFVNGVLWGGLQYSDGPNQYGVRKSLFFYQPDAVPGFTYDTNRDWRSWTSWNKRTSEDIGRGYNYPHVVAAYWAMYRVARNNPGLVGEKPWDWYLEQAYQTLKFMFSRTPNGQRRVGYVELGLMDGTSGLEVLNDLKREGWNDKAAEITALMKERADRWKKEEYPFGSEMAWDSTGQEEVYAWCRYFGY